MLRWLQRLCMRVLASASAGCAGHCGDTPCLGELAACSSHPELYPKMVNTLAYSLSETLPEDPAKQWLVVAARVQEHRLGVSKAFFFFFKDEFLI